MGDLIGTIIIIVIAYLVCKVPEWKHSNRLCPPGKEIDYGKANHDLIVNNIGKQEYYRRYNSGYYDKDK